MLFLETDDSDETLVIEHQDLKSLYEDAFVLVANFVKKMGGSVEDTRELLHDAFIIYCDRESEGSDCRSGQAYIFGICRHLWYRRHKENRKVISLEKWETEVPLDTDAEPTLRQKRLLRVLELGGKRCLDLLYRFYYSRLPKKEIAGSLGYSNAHSLSVQKYKCIQKMKGIIKQKAIQYDDFFE